MTIEKKTSLLFVCTGNICRSPSAEGVFRYLIESKGLESAFNLDSAGLIAYHVGEKPDPRSIDEAMSRGVDISHQRARKFVPIDFENFDYIFAMDYGHYSDMNAMSKTGKAKNVHLFLEPIRDDIMCSEVPDPYYGGPDGFKDVYDMIEKACEAWLNRMLPNT